MSQTMLDNHIGLIFIDERHQIQFSSDMEIIFISPPSLDTYRRWLVDWINRSRNATHDDSMAEPRHEN